MTLTINLPDEQAAALQAKAAAAGLTLEAWFKKVADEEVPTEQLRRAQAAAARILAIQKRSLPDPEGWTVRDYINHSRP